MRPGLPANADTYLHLAGRAGRWPRAGRAVVTTIATRLEIGQVRGWGKGLGGLKFEEV